MAVHELDLEPNMVNNVEDEDEDQVLEQMDEDALGQEML